MEFRMQIPRWILALLTVLTSFVCMAAPLTPDDLALIDFRNSGIICTHSGRVQNITLSAQVPMLEGNISTSLGKLNLLEGLMLDQNMLSGSIPPEPGNLSSLRMLVLSNYRLTGRIPPPLTTVAALSNFDLIRTCSLNFPESLGNLKNLGSLNLISNLLSGEIPLTLQLSFAAMTNLSYFSIGFNFLSGFGPPILHKNLATLEYYDISNNNFLVTLPQIQLHFVAAQVCASSTMPITCVTRSLQGAMAKLRLAARMIVDVELGAVLALALVAGVVVFIALRFRRRGPVQEEMPLERAAEKEQPEMSNLTNEPCLFTCEEIMKATEDLSGKYVIGRGGHSLVYKVECASGTRPSIVVKKIEFTNKKTKVLLQKSFWREIKTIGKVRHRNLVKLLGFIKRDKLGLLLYDNISNGDLHSEADLNSKARLHIARVVSQELAYLHHDYDTLIVHRNVQ